MKRQIQTTVLVLLASVCLSQAQTTAFTYQGLLNDGGAPAAGLYDLQVSLQDASSNVVAGPLANTVAATNGLFTLSLDFGAAPFTGADRWLQLAVRTNGSGNFTPILPRQRLTATPYATRAANFSGAVLDTQLSTNVARLNGSQTFSGAVNFNNVSNRYAGAFAGNGAGVTNIPFAAIEAPGLISWPGNFVLVSSNDSGAGAISIAAADFNDDGKLDAVLVNELSGSVVVLTNNGAGRFASFGGAGIGGRPHSVIAADLNGDGKADFVIASWLNSALHVWFRVGGTFNPVQVITNMPGARSVAVADVNGDGRLDLISANFDGGNLAVLTNTSNPSIPFVLASTNAVSGSPHAVTAADVNGDGRPDLISANYNDDSVTILTNLGGGHFASSVSVPVGSRCRGVAAGDINGDGKADLVTANDFSLSVITNTGANGFVLATNIAVPGRLSFPPRSRISTAMDGSTSSPEARAMCCTS